MPSLNSQAGPFSNKTWKQCALIVARSVNGHRDPEKVLEAMEALGEILLEMDTEKDWRFLQVVAEPIALTSGGGPYDLPSDFKKPYDAYLLGAAKKVDYIERRFYNTILPAFTGNLNEYAYSTYNSGQTGQFEILPSSPEDSLILRYYAFMPEPGDDDETVRIPARFVPVMLAGARMIMCDDNGYEQKAARWEARYQKRLLFAKADDARIPDEEIRFIPAVAATPLDPTLRAAIGALP